MNNNKWKLKDIINKHSDHKIHITYREYEFNTKGEQIGEGLFGMCEWDTKELKPLDGDSYSLEDEIVGWIYDYMDKDNYKLTVWQNVELLESNEVDEYIKKKQN